VLLSVAALVTVYIDPTRPTLTRWLPLTGGPFTLDPLALAAMIAHLVYSVATDVALRGRLVSATRIASASTWADVLFGGVIALVTEGANSPSCLFFAFAVLAAGFRAGLQLTLKVTVASVALYLSLILVTYPEGVGFYIMRPVYLAITGYLVGYLGEQRLIVEARVRSLETARQRERIARSLHDEYVQALAGVNVRLATCYELLRRGSIDRALAELKELQAGVNREHDALRAYIRSLLDLESQATPCDFDHRTYFSIEARFKGSLLLVEHALNVILEGARNVALHARANSAAISAEASVASVVITIDDDGVGFPAGAPPPWSIASRAAELGGEVRLREGSQPGAHIEIELPMI
jgi:signal transduction histidine kinase